MKTKIPYKWELVIWLFIAFFFNQADRQVFNVLLLDIQNDLGLTSKAMGLVGTSLILVNGLFLPVAGILGDRVSKKWILVAALAIWSTATMFTGLTMTLPGLIMLRSVATGGGEAFYAPSANKLISENHPVESRATALSVHQSALYTGFIISGVAAAALAAAMGWRKVFFLFGGLGILLAALMAWRIHPDKVEKSSEPVGSLIRGGLRAFFTSPTAWMLALACAGFNFAGQAFLVWMPTCLHDTLGLDTVKSAFDASFYPQTASICGVLIGARLADRNVGRQPKSRMIVQTAGFVLGAPFLFLIGVGSTEFVLCLAMVGYGLFKGMYDSNLFAAVYDVVDAKYSAMATSFILMFSFLIACTSPLLLGVLKPAIGLAGGMKLMSVVYLASAIPLLIAIIYTFDKERRSKYENVHEN